MKGSKVLLLIVILLAGSVLGGFLADMTKGISYLSWLSYGNNFGIDTNNPLVLNLAVLKIKLGMTVQINIAIIIGLAGAFLFYRKTM